MEVIFEILFELVLEGSLELAASRDTPWPLRILCAGILLLVYGGLLVLTVLLMNSGIRDRDWALLLVGLVCAALFLVAGWFLVQKIRGKSV